MELSKESIDEIDGAAELESMRKVEAALFVAGRFMRVQELVALTDVNPILLKKILEDMADKYRDSGIELVNRENLWKMDVSQNYAWMVNKLAGGSSEFTKAEQETLALIAYKQPMKQSVVVKIRGNKAYEHIKGFVERGLVNKKKMGHTAELTVAENFFNYFSLNNEGEIFANSGEDIQGNEPQSEVKEGEVIKEEKPQ